MEAGGPSAAKLPSRYVSLTYFQNGSLRRWDLACVADFCLKGRGRRGRLCPASILSVSCYCCASPTHPVIAIEQWLPCPSGRATRQGVVIGNLPAEFWFRKRTIIAYAARDTDFRFAGASTAAAAIHRRAITPPGRVTRDRSSASALLHAGKRKRVSIARAVAGQGYAWAQGVVEVRCSSSPFGIIAQKRRPMHARRNKGGRGSRGGKG